MESTAPIETILACQAVRFEVRHLAIQPNLILIQIACGTNSVACPACGCLSRRVHSRYMRSIADLPWRGIPVVLRCHIRRFFCDQIQCPRRIFAESLEPAVFRRGRTTGRLDETLRKIGLECGGEPGRRLGAQLGIKTSGDTILRRVRAIPPVIELKPSAIGIDDFALRKGHQYGTVLVDHESHRVIDLLPDRSSDSTARWMASQPQVQIVTRDRSTLYAKGVSAANPAAIQIADRFHLHANLREALVRMLDRHHADISKASQWVQAEVRSNGETPASEGDSSAAAPPPTPVAPMNCEPPRLSKTAKLSMERRTRRLAKFERVIALKDSDKTLRAISRELGIGRDLVTRFLRAGSFPELARTRRPRAINQVIDELRQLWDSGIYNACELHRRLRAGGFAGSLGMVRRCVRPWRHAIAQSMTCHAEFKPVRISSSRLGWLLLKSDINREAEEQKLIDRLLEDCEPVRAARELVLQFKEILPKRRSELLLEWIDRARQTGVAEDIRGFAEGLVRDWPSVKVAVELPWSNGRAEGHVNRIKLIKRKMYGRANFDLLRIRVLARGP